MPFVTIGHEQNTAAWLNWRLDGIGASDAPAVMGENPWKRPERLLAEKVAARRSYFVGRAGGHGGGWGGGREGGSAAGRGTALEPHARARYCAHRGVDAQPACLESRARSWQRASLDGIDHGRGHAVEIKCGEKVYALTAASGTVPGYYYGQLQHILSVTGFAAVDFWVWLPGRRPLLLTVERDEAYIARLVEREAAFWEAVLAGREAAAKPRSIPEPYPPRASRGPH